MEPERLNSPDTSAILFELLGHQLQFSQDPNSKHLGTTVWDASMVFAKFLEKNCRKGRFSPSRLKGKRAIELGAGCGVAGLGMALLGCDVVSTDQTEVLPLLMRNVERNASRIMQTDPGSDSFGSIEVAELNWGNVDHINAVGPPFDYIIGTDVVYAEHLLEPLLQTMLALSGPKTTILLGYELRSTNVHEQMLSLWKRNFEVKNVPKAKMDNKYQHSSIQLFIMSLKPSEGSAESRSNGLDQQISEIKTTDTVQEEDEDADNNNDTEKLDDFGDNKAKEDGVFAPIAHNGKLSEWDARRFKRCGVTSVATMGRTLLLHSIFAALTFLTVYKVKADDPCFGLSLMERPHLCEFLNSLINGFLGPTLDAVTNDNLIINVINKLDNPFLLTWALTWYGSIDS